MMLTSKGTAGVAGGAFVVLASSLTAIGSVPVAALALIVGVDRILNEGRVFINVLGNAIATIVVAKWEGDFDQDRAKQAHSTPSTTRTCSPPKQNWRLRTSTCTTAPSIPSIATPTAKRQSQRTNAVHPDAPG